MVTEKAMELGQAIVECPEYKAYIEAKEALEADANATNLLDSYGAKEQELNDLIAKDPAASETINALASELEELRKEAVSHGKIATLAMAQNDFNGIMAMVNSILMQYVNPQAQQEQGSCGGDCAGCAGCH